MQLTSEDYGLLARAILDRIDRINALENQTEAVGADRKTYEALLEKITALKKSTSTTANQWDGSLNDIYAVGPNKPLAYLTESHIVEAGSTVESIKEWAKEKGWSTQTFPKGTRGHTSSILYVYDAKILQELLQKHAELLTQAGWPLDPDEYVSKLATTAVEPGSGLYKVVAWSFADYSNPNL